MTYFEKTAASVIDVKAVTSELNIKSIVIQHGINKRMKAACVHEYARDLGQMAHHLALSGNGIYYEHHVFLCARHAARKIGNGLRHRVRTLGVKAAVLLAHGVVNGFCRLEGEVVFPSAHHLHRVYGAA